jgi:hypothetical protein
MCIDCIPMAHFNLIRIKIFGKVQSYEDGVISKADLVGRLSNMNDEKERLEERLAPIEKQMGQGGIPNKTIK